MEIEEMERAVNEARQTIRRADTVVATMANIIRGRLRLGNVSGYILNDIKGELQKWDMHRKVWKD